MLWRVEASWLEFVVRLHRLSSNINARSRILGTFDSIKPTPKKAYVGGVTFLRSKNGNLYRSGIVKAKKYVWISRPNSKLDCTKAINLEDMCTSLTFNRESGKVKKIEEPCKRFTATGTPFLTPQSCVSRSVQRSMRHAEWYRY
jgi:hypothetical protein